MIEIGNYSFGKIELDGKNYDKDLIILEDGVYANWWRKEGHHLVLSDLEKILKRNPEIIIIGTGFYGLMRVDDSVIKKLAEENVELIIEKTTEAVKCFAKYRKERKTAAALHLTC